ncbi:Cell division ATPase FtsA [Pseudobutyrivibrio sp. JW11]|uniref:cell division FtsA domain-containing protein n=1 Tax=Pseudobutyrivibrio sp. JW11 TaxID=1855302 RepID=UPI0008E13C1F|nr:cell division FtsA domain-containing protein [Pseudobutyrivibrio sp. JW11]SFN84972.1 Cell division ATPase FtsA [Pseudobutyrivibrio sp. JW11]
MEKKDIVFGLDIGTRNVIGTVGYLDGDEFHVIAQNLKEHDTRAMLDGQIHDIGRVGATCDEVKKDLEAQTGLALSEVCIAAAGRVLRTITTHVEMEFPEETVVTGEDLHTLDMMGIEQAGKEIKGDEDNKYKFFCVGYSTVKYYLNGDVFTSLEDHKADTIGEDIIVTFLPEDVVDGLYSAVGKADLSVANLTLEPIAAINVAIPQSFRMLNIALIDVGAGTSDICVTRDGSIIAYGMIPMAGDELTEVLVHEYLVDFATAEKIKRASTEGGEITYEDIMGLSHTIKSEDVWKLTEPVMKKIASEVAEKIKELNGGKSVSAAFVVGGGGKIHGFTEALAADLKIVPERVALRGEEVMKNIVFEQEDIAKDSLLVTPIGICLNYYETKNNFIMIHFNGEMMKLYDNGQLTIVDAAMQAGFSADQLFPRRGREINFTVNGVSRMIRGTEGESAVVTMNGKTVGINTPLEFNADVTVVPSTVGEGGRGTIADLAEFTTEYLYFNVCGHRVKCPKFVEVNGSMEPPTYSVKDGDVIETRPFYTVGQLAEFMDVTIDDRYEILVNNRPSTKESLVYENFAIEWTTTNQIAYRADYLVDDSEGLPEDYEAPTAPEAPAEDARTRMKIETVEIPIKVNGKDMVLAGKRDYIFVDVYNLINFDPSTGGGRQLITKVNGQPCGYAKDLNAGDEVEIRWSES